MPNKKQPEKMNEVEKLENLSGVSEIGEENNEVDEDKKDDEQRVTFSLVRQGKHRFYTLTLNSDLLARTCFVSTRYDDPTDGFQRTLEIRRAQQIAEYIDNGLGTIPNSIILSAQPEAEMKVIKDGKILSFIERPKSFLVLDGQHRVYGFSLAKSKLRVPVVIYNGLSRKEESRLFIDINTKQRPVPNELLLDIKKLAEYETDTEQLMNRIYDLFNTSSDSPLIGLMSPYEKQKGKISRPTFNGAIKPILNMFKDQEIHEIYIIVRSYIEAFCYGLREISAEEYMTKPVVFRAMVQFFGEVVPRVKYKFDGDYSTDNFYDVLRPVFSEANSSWFSNSGITQRSLYQKMEKAIDKNFTV